MATLPYHLSDFCEHCRPKLAAIIAEGLRTLAGITEAGGRVMATVPYHLSDFCEQCRPKLAATIAEGLRSLADITEAEPTTSAEDTPRSEGQP
jgi:hypothetical protein